MQLFDTHCHLNLTEFDGKLHQSITDAKNAGVAEILVPGTNIETSKKAVAIAQSYPGVYAACGIHPTEPLETLDLSEALFKIEELISSGKDVIKGVGEVGLDFYRFTAAPRIQESFLVSQIQLAKKYSLALILHNRMAEDTLLSVLTSNWSNDLAFRTVFHCCEPSEKLLEFAKERGVFIGVDGDYTYDLEKQAFAKKIPLELLVVETDSPYLLPEPLKSKNEFPNVPKNIIHTAVVISKLLSVSVEEIASQTTQNAQRLFALSHKENT